MTKICYKCGKELDISNFKVHKGRKDGLQAQCTGCQKKYRKDHYEKNRQKYIDKAKKWNEEFRSWWQDYKSTLKCEHCGEDHIACLDFHHTNPDEKEHNPSALLSLGNKQKVLDEIAKCIVLCSNCHRKVHYEERKRA